MIHTYQKRLDDLIGCEIHGASLRENDTVLALALSVRGAEFRIALEPCGPRAADAWFSAPAPPSRGWPCKVTEVVASLEPLDDACEAPDGAFVLRGIPTRGRERHGYEPNSSLVTVMGQFVIATTSGPIHCVLSVTSKADGHGNPGGTCYPLCSVVVVE